MGSIGPGGLGCQSCPYYVLFLSSCFSYHPDLFLTLGGFLIYKKW